MARPLKNKVTAVYMRVSTPGQKFDSQEGQLLNICRMRGWDQSRVYAEKISGDGRARPQFDLMLRHAREGRLARIVVYKLDRLGRSLGHLVQIFDEMAKLRVPVISATEGLDTDDQSASGKLTLQVLSCVAEFQKNLIRERTRHGQAAAKARGVRLGRPNKLDRFADTARKLRARGASFRAIARTLKLPLGSVHRICQS
jgi:putative DNA-invertase from lambdoid prophage Rac